MMPMYKRLPNVPGFGVEATATNIGAGVIIASAAIFGTHGVVTVARNWKKTQKARKESRDIAETSEQADE